MDASNQAMIFLGSVYAGLSLGGIFDIFRLIKLSINSRIIHIILDILFCLTAFCVILIALYVLSLLELRLYTLIGIALGVSIYLTGISMILQLIIKKISKKQKNPKVF